MTSAAPTAPTPSTVRHPGIPGATNVDHVAYTVPDLDQAVAFFTEVVGAELIYREGPVHDPHGDMMRRQLGVHPQAVAHIAMLRLGPVTNLELFEYDAPDQNRVCPANSDWGGHHLAIHVTDIDAAVCYLREQPGVELLGAARTIPGGPIAGNRWLYFRTPWGMQMELVQASPGRPYENTTSARRYGPASAWDTDHPDCPGTSGPRPARNPMRDQIDMTPALLDYVRDVSLREDGVLRELREDTAALPDRIMQILPEEAQFLALLIRLTAARDVLEIGTFTGYSALAMARALPPGGQVVTCDVSEEWTAMARRAWQRAGITERIDLRLGDASATLETLLTERGPASFDLVFIDADKAHYPHYYEQSLTLTRPGGLIVLDNTLWSGRVIDPAAHDADTQGVREVNDTLLKDERVDVAMLPMADGVTLARKRHP